jgi:uncharacterized protein (DUF1684 family)
LIRIISILLLLFTFCAFADVKESSSVPYEKEIEKWKAGRLTSLQSETGWLTLIGLFWLEPGQNQFGSDPKNQIVITSQQVPKFAGSFWLNQDSVLFESIPGVNITSDGKKVETMQLHSDAEENPTVLNLVSLNFYLIKRMGRFGIRVKDTSSPARKEFAGLQYFPLNPSWNIHAKFEKYTPPKKIPIVNVLGMTDEMESPGAIVFEHAGAQYRLDAILEKGDDELFMIFSDTTSGKETYGAGRYLYIPMPDAQGSVFIDFNKAYNPPCAFTSYATCPLPPPQNKLKLRIDAGEKKYAGKIH